MVAKWLDSLCAWESVVSCFTQGWSGRPKPGRVYPKRPSGWTQAVQGEARYLAPPRAQASLAPGLTLSRGGLASCSTALGGDLGEFFLSARAAGFTCCQGSRDLLLRPGLQCLGGDLG